jgi:hypothetical protein
MYLVLLQSILAFSNASDEDFLMETRGIRGKPASYVKP